MERSGTLLASATFTNETASGWQQVTFSSPVAISASTTYVAGYLAPNGHYSDTATAFASAGSTTRRCDALANGVSANGVYAYSVQQLFPTSSYKATNYWVDVDFRGPVDSPPGPPTGVTANCRRPGQAQVSWTAPSRNGGSASPATR